MILIDYAIISLLITLFLAMLLELDVIKWISSLIVICNLLLVLILFITQPKFILFFLGLIILTLILRSIIKKNKKYERKRI